MTYRRLSRFLVVTSTLLLVLLWTVSSRRWMDWTGSYPPYSFTCCVYGSTISLNLGKGSSRTFVFTSSREAPPVGDVGRELYGGTGRFRFEKYPHAISGSTGPRGYLIDFPIWLPWLLITTSGWLILRFLEKRSGSGAEKELAGKNVGAMVEQDPE